jgi:hypothetical protein
MVVEAMAQTGNEATYCMGDDIPLAVLSDKPHPLYNYFKQRFAQVRGYVCFVVGVCVYVGFVVCVRVHVCLRLWWMCVPYILLHKGLTTSKELECYVSSILSLPPPSSLINTFCTSVLSQTYTPHAHQFCEASFPR